MSKHQIEDLKHSISNELMLATLLSRPSLSSSQIEESQRLISCVDMVRLNVLVNKHRIWPCAYINIKNHFSHLFCIEFSEKLRKKYQQNKRRSHKQFEAYTKILQQFKAREIPTRLIKGLLLGQKLYGDVSKRHSKDIDIVIPQDNIRLAHKELVKQGYREKDNNIDLLSNQQLQLYLGYHKDFEYKHDSFGNLELHVRLFEEKTRLSQYCTEKLFSSQDSEINEFIYLCLHGTQSLYHRLKWLVDIALYIERHTADSADFLEQSVTLAKQLDACRALTVSCILAHTLYGTQLPVSIHNFYKKDYLTRIIVKRSLYTLNHPESTHSFRYDFESSIYEILLPTKLGEKWHYLERRLRPSVLDIMAFPGIPDKFSAMYYLLRPFTLFYRKVANKVR